MAETTGISWCDATFNPWWGCTKVSPACDGCYAEAWALRFNLDIWGLGKDRRYFGDKHWNEPRKWNAKAAKEGKRLRVFCASMADVFDNEVGQEHRERLWALIRETPSLAWLIVTKRIGNAAKMLPADWGSGYPNVWLLITVINQDEVDRDVPKLLATPAAVRGLSIEPMLGPIDLYNGDPDPRLGGHKATKTFLGDWWEPGDDLKGPSRHGVDWVICGGESGPKARPVHPDWIRSLRDQCQAAEVAFHFKQWGEWAPSDHHPKRELVGIDPEVAEHECTFDGSAAAEMAKLGKKAAGHLLDGREWREFPA